MGCEGFSRGSADRPGARLGLPALDGLVFPAMLVLGVVCWVIGSGTRTERVSRLLLAWRGTAVDTGLVPALNRLVDPVTRR